VIPITASDTAFDPNLVWVAENETVSFQVTNTGSQPHQFWVGPFADVLSANPSSPAKADLQPGEGATVTTTLTGPGPYAFASHDGADLASGYIGYIIVTGKDVPKVGTQAQPRLIPLKVAEDGFNRPSVPVQKGETVTFIVANVGTQPHAFIIGPADKVASNAVDQTTTVTTGAIPAGHVAALTYTFPSSGDFAFASHEGGDDAAGVKGTIALK
jgi:uncharacterized cupredoxin-like copper-binding protein